MPKGKHGRHARARRQHRWSEEKMFTSSGYVKLRVGVTHPLADPNGYAYEHLVIWCAAGRERPRRGELLHHRNEVKSDNRLENLRLKARGAHGVEHHGADLSDADVRAIREAYASGSADTRVLSMRHKITIQRAWKIVRGLTRVAAGGPIMTGPLR
jgi:hypothetical protein